MTPFWYLLAGTFVLTGGVMFYMVWLGREVPDEADRQQRTRLSADSLRILSYVLVAVIVLFATMYELRLMYSP